MDVALVVIAYIGNIALSTALLYAERLRRRQEALRLHSPSKHHLNHGEMVAFTERCTDEASYGWPLLSNA